jgi:hypothetical protein
MRGSSGSIASLARFNLVLAGLGAVLALFLLPAVSAHAGVAPKRFGEIDCNGFSRRRNRHIPNSSSPDQRLNKACLAHLPTVRQSR